MTDLPPNIQSIVDKVEKLLRLASNNPNEAEAQAATNKASELLAAYNLDMATVQQSGGKTDKREDRKTSGGLYKWQRELWNDVAKLNFCLYQFYRGLVKGSKYEHRLIGRTVNIVSTRLMAEYLEQAIERITRECYDNDPARYFSREGIAYREGMADRIGERLRERRREQERADTRAKAENQAKRPNTANALTVVDVRKSEAEANEEFEYDLRHGPGAWANVKKRQAENLAIWEQREREAEEATRRWQEEHPEEYAAQLAARAKEEERERKREERNARRRTGSSGNSKGWEPRADSYYDGRERGNDVSLDKQIDRNSQKKLGR